MYTAAIDIGGSKSVVGVIDEHGKVLAAKKMSTKKESCTEHFELTLKALDKCMEELFITKEDLTGLGVVLPGMVSGGKLLYAPALSWRDIDIIDNYRALSGIENIKTEGDVNACGIAEAYFGGFDDLLWVTVSNGIGGAIISGGKLFKGAHDVAGEIGHIKVEYDEPRLCSCSQYGCAEAMASGSGIRQSVEEMAEDDEDYKRLYIDNEKPFTAESCAFFAQKGDEISLNILDMAGVYIGRALSAALNVLDPKRVFIGGGVALSLDLLLPAIKRTVDASCVEFVRNTPIEQTRLGYYAALIGAAALVLKEK